MVPALQGFLEILLDPRHLDLIQLLPQGAQEDVSSFREMLEDIRVERRETLRRDVAGSEGVEVRIVPWFQLTGRPYAPSRVDIGKRREAASNERL